MGCQAFLGGPANSRLSDDDSRLGSSGRTVPAVRISSLTETSCRDNLQLLIAVVPLCPALQYELVHSSCEDLLCGTTRKLGDQLQCRT
jgi:hypothetical protein